MIDPIVRSPLAGVRVVEWGRFITAPYAAMLLADLGADVLKIESPEGDPFRVWNRDEVSPRFAAYNRNKRSLSLDTRAPEGLALAQEVIRSADVFVHNMRSGAVRALGVDQPSLRDQAPNLVYCGITGVREVTGVDSPPAYDAIGQALSGLTSVLSGETLEPVGPALSDLATGIFAALGILAALHRRAVRRATGEAGGEEVRTSMVTATAALTAEAAAYFFATGKVPDARSRVRNSLAFTLRAADGLPVAIQLSTPERSWRLLVAALDAPELADDDRFSSYERRVAEYDALAAELQSRFARRDRAVWLQAFAAHDTPCAPVLTVAEAYAPDREPSVNLVVPMALGEGDESRSTPRAPVELAGMPDSVAPPSLGAGGVEALRAWGLDPDSVGSLVARGVVRDERTAARAGAPRPEVVR